MPESPLPTTPPEAEQLGLRLYAAMLEEHGLAAALDVIMDALGSVAAMVRRVPVSGPVGDDRGTIACRHVGIEQSLALALWWNSAAGCAALASLGGEGGVVEHGRGRRVPAALRQAVTLILEVERQGFCAVTLWRREGARGLGRQEAVLLAALSPHLGRAIGSELRRMRAALRAELLEGSGEAVIILDADERVVSVSQGLRALLADGDGLRLTERGLQATDPAEQARLAMAICAAMRPADGIARDSRLAIPRALAPTPWLLEARALRPHGRAGVALIVTEPRPRPAPSETVLRDSLGLTAAESALAVSLAGGIPLAEHRRWRRIPQAALRAQLSGLLAKLNCHRPDDAVATLNALAPSG